MRINKYLALCGVGSRRKCDEYISKSLVKVNGKVMNDFSYNVKNDDFVQYKNELLEAPLLETYILNKPRGYICTKDDNFNRKRIYDLIPNQKLFSIGRLDYDTSGIILLTNDGDLSYKLTHPKFNIEKKYIVCTDGKLNNNDINVVKKGIIVDRNIKYKAKISFLNKDKKNYNYEVMLTEGKNREIKRIFNYFHINVLKLHRYDFGGIVLKDLPVGKYRKINLKEIKILEQLF